MKKILERSDGLEQIQELTVCGYPVELWRGLNLSQRRSLARVYFRAYGIDKLIEELVGNQDTTKLRGTICGYPVKDWTLVDKPKRQIMAGVYALAYGVNKVIEQLTIE